MNHRIGLAQVNARDDVQANLDTARDLVRQASAEGLSLIAFPEMFLWVGDDRSEKFRLAQTIEGGFVQQFQEEARAHNISILIGSLYEAHPERDDRVFNTSVLLDRSGGIRAVYRKIHLCDVPVLDNLESRHIAPGNEAVAVGHEIARLGLTICYDLRFPGLYQALARRGAELIFVPSAFFMETGKDHWLALLRARAIENQVYIAAPAQWGWHYGRRSSFGNTVLIDPWGTVLAHAPERTGLISGTIDLEHLRDFRNRLPVNDQQRPDCYR